MTEQIAPRIRARVTRNTGKVEHAEGFIVSTVSLTAATSGTPITRAPFLHLDAASEKAERERIEEMARRGEITLGLGGVPDGFWEMPIPEDPEDSVKKALIENRDHAL